MHRAAACVSGAAAVHFDNADSEAAEQFARYQ